MDAAAYRMCFDEDKLAILCAQYDRRLDSIGTENAKLRELVRDMFRDFANADYELKRNHGRTFMAVTRYEPRLQELGIEVDE